MGTSDITVSALVAIDDVAGIKLEWAYSDPRNAALFNIALDMVEVWAAAVNDRDGAPAVKVGEGITDYSHAGLPRGAVRYYWIRARNNLGNHGAWHPASSTAGVVGTELSGNFSDDLPGYWEQPGGLIEQYGFDVTDGSGDATVTFALEFPDVCFSVVATPTVESGVPGIVNIVSKDTAGFVVKGYAVTPGSPASIAVGSLHFFWRAIGF